MEDMNLTLDQEQLEQICGTLLKAVSFHHNDALEHLLGPCREPFSLVAGIHRIADALESIAESLGDK